jgi:hypothetical protein
MPSDDGGGIYNHDTLDACAPTYNALEKDCCNSLHAIPSVQIKWSKNQMDGKMVYAFTWLVLGVFARLVMTGEAFTIANIISTWPDIANSVMEAGARPVRVALNLHVYTDIVFQA